MQSLFHVALCQVLTEEEERMHKGILQSLSQKPVSDSAPNPTPGL